MIKYFIVFFVPGCCRKAEDGLQQFNQTTPEQAQQQAQNSNGDSTSDKTRHGYAYGMKDFLLALLF